MSLTDEKFECFKIDIQDKIAHIILNRPEKMNSLPVSFWSDLPRIINELDYDALARVIVISSTCKHFSAVMYLSVFSNAENARNKENPQTDPGRKKGSFYKGLLKLQETFNCIDNSRIPVLMAIQGGCIGGAVDFASAGPSAVNRFMIPPKITTTQRGNLTGVVSGAIIYNTSTNKLQVFNGSSWVNLH